MAKENMAYRTDNTAKNSYDNYQFGTAAPKIDPERIQRNSRKYDQEYVEKALREVREDVERRKNAAASFSRGQVALILVLMAVILAVSCFYIMKLSSHHEKVMKLESLQQEYQELTKDNQLLSQRIDQCIDYEAVYQYATETLKMQIPASSQVISYAQSTCEYVCKGSEIPNE